MREEHRGDGVGVALQTRGAARRHQAGLREQAGLERRKHTSNGASGAGATKGQARTCKTCSSGILDRASHSRPVQSRAPDSSSEHVLQEVACNRVPRQQTPPATTSAPKPAATLAAVDGWAQPP